MRSIFLMSCFLTGLRVWQWVYPCRSGNGTKSRRNHAAHALLAEMPRRVTRRDGWKTLDAASWSSTTTATMTSRPQAVCLGPPNVCITKCHDMDLDVAGWNLDATGNKVRSLPSLVLDYSQFCPPKTHNRVPCRRCAVHIQDSPRMASIRLLRSPRALGQQPKSSVRVRCVPQPCNGWVRATCRAPSDGFPSKQRRQPRRAWRD